MTAAQSQQISKAEIIASITAFAPGKADVNVLATKSISELTDILAQAATAFAQENEDKILRAEADRAVSAYVHRMKIAEAQAPRLKAEAAAQLKKDREVFEQTAKETKAFSINEANFQVIRELYSPLDLFTMKEIVKNGLLLGKVSPATPEELQQWTQEAAEARANYLVNHASHEELKQASRFDREQSRAEFQRQKRERQIADLSAKAVNYPPLPTHNSLTGEALDMAFFNRLSVNDLPRFKQYCRKYGPNITKRLNGLG